MKIKKLIPLLFLAAAVMLVTSSCFSMRSTDITQNTDNINKNSALSANTIPDTVGETDNPINPADAEQTDDDFSPPDTISEPEEKQEPVTTKISFLAAGDNVIHPCIYLEAKQRATKDTREYNFKPMYSDIIELVQSYDIAFINQETLMGGEELGYSGYPRFNSPQDLGYDLVEMGFDIVNIANNHMADQWEKGLKGTIEFWRNQPVTLIGEALNGDEYEIPDIIEKDGISIAFLSYTYGTNGLSLPASSELVVPYINDNDILRHISNAKDEAELVFVSVHWGEENTFTPTSEQKRLAKLMADAGVDVIIGHHPHVVQPIEWIEGKDGNKTLCIYSLGNLVSAMMYSQNMAGGFLTFDIIKTDNFKPYIENVKFLPTVFFYGMNYYSTHLYMMEDYTDELAKKHGTQIYGNYASAAQMKKYIIDNISSEFLPDWMIN